METNRTVYPAHGESLLKDLVVGLKALFGTYKNEHRGVKIVKKIAACAIGYTIGSLIGNGWVALAQESENQSTEISIEAPVNIVFGAVEYEYVNGVGGLH